MTGAILAAAESWYGYGRWDAPYWFVGPEPGMNKKEGNNLLERCEAWRDLGSGELLDCTEHHRAFGHVKYHTRSIAMKIPVGNHAQRPPTQSTWRQLIRLLLAFKGERTDNDAVADYQCDSWGSMNGETCVVELSALAANNLSERRDRAAFRQERCEHLRKRLLENAPTFVVLYGLGSRASFEQIIGDRFDGEDYAWCGQTLCTLTPSPTSRSRGNYRVGEADWWVTKGVAMAHKISERRQGTA